MLKALYNNLLSLLEEKEDYTIPSPTLETFRAYHQCYSLHSYFPYESYQDGLYLNRSTVGFVLETLPIMGFTEESHSQLAGLFQYVLPEESNIQILLFADPYIGGALKTWKDARFSSSPMLHQMAESRVQAFYDLASSQNRLLSARFFRVIISVTLPYGDKDLESRLLEGQDLKDRLEETLKMVGLYPSDMTPNHLLSFLDDLFCVRLQQNEFQPFMPHYTGTDFIRNQALSHVPSIQVHRGGLSINEGEQVFRGYQVVHFPRQWHQMHMGELLGSHMQLLQQLPFPFLIHYGVHIPKQQELTLKTLAKGSHLERQMQSPIAKHLPNLRLELDEYQFVKKQVGEGHRFVRSQMTVGLLSPAEHMTRFDQMLTNLYRAKGFRLRQDEFFHLQSLMTLLPMSFGDDFLKDLTSSQKLKTTISSESANLLPLQGEWYGTRSPHTSPGMLLLGRRGQVTFWSPFDNQSGNYNVSVVGRSGSGKSVFMQELMTATLAQGGRVFVLDVGRSFEKTCLLLEGQFIEFTPHTPLCLNPFSTLGHNSSGYDIEDSLSMLKSVLCTMAAPNHGVDDLEASYLEQAMRETWRQFQTQTTLTHIAQWLLNHGDKKAKDLGTMLYPYTKTGMYGRFFEGVSNVDFQKPLVVVELEELKERKDLQAVIVQMVIVLISNQMFLGNRQQPFMIVFDEAWDMLRGGQSGTFIETLARRLRKYNGSLVVGTQSVNDFYQSPGAQAAYDNSDWLCLLSQKPESIALLKENKRIHLTPMMEETLKSVHTKGGAGDDNYAECLIYGPHGYAVTRLVLDSFSKTLYSTKASDYGAVKSLMDQGISIEQAVAKVAKEAA
jgi:conjugal transfer ATP-binding protein TraC